MTGSPGPFTWANQEINMARYRDAIEFVVHNDDTEFLNDEPCHISVTGSLIGYLFNKSDEQVVKDLRRAAKARDKALAQQPVQGVHDSLIYP